MRARREAVGAHIKALREERGLSQWGLAARAGLERKAVQRIETANAVPTLDRLFELADALGVTSSDLLAADPGSKRERVESLVAE